MTDAAPGSRLVDAYDQVIFDLDGVIYLIDQPIPGAAAAVDLLHREGRHVAYATNNASRRSSEVAALLTGMGVAAHPEEVLTSAAAAAELLRRRLQPEAPVLVVGAEALRAELEAVGLRAVRSADDRPVAVVQGYGPQVGWADLAEASVAVRAGALWVATNTDRTLPTARGPLPGNGALVAALATALGRQPDIVVGKPEPALFETAAQLAGARRSLVVGDRLDTDIEGAARAGLDSLLVLTGVSDVRDLLAAPEGGRPTYVAFDLLGLSEPGAAVAVPGVAEPGGWQVSTGPAGLWLSGGGDTLGALAVLCAAAWVAGPPTVVTAESTAAHEALRRLGLAD